VTSPGPRDRGYVRAVERVLTRLNGRGAVLSPRDFALLSRWQREGVPLGTVLEALETAGRRPRSRGLVTLAYASAAVSDAWAVIREGRAPAIKPRALASISLEEARRRWAAASQSVALGSGLGDLLRALVRRLDAGEEPERLDLDLDRELPGAVSGAVLAEADRSARARIATGVRPAQEASEAAVRRAVVDRLRHSLDLPRLALCEGGRGPDAPEGSPAPAKPRRAG